MRGSSHRTLVVVAVLVLIAAACDSTSEVRTTDPTPIETSAPTSSTNEPVEGFTYTVGMFGDVVGNFWAYFGPPGNLASQFVFEPTKASLFRIAHPGLVVAPDVASGLPELAEQEGEVWTVTQPIRDDYTWSDGSQLTADDVVFTFETVRDAELGAAWKDAYPYSEDAVSRLLDVEAVDDFTLKYTFDTNPGAAVWPHQVGVGPIMPRAPWEELVVEALETDDPAAVLYAADPVAIGDLYSGPMVYNGREEGVSIENVRNEHYANKGFVHQFWDDGSYALNGKMLYGVGDGDPSVEYTEGPYTDRTLFRLFDDIASARVALIDGEIDFQFELSGMPPAARRQGLEAGNLAVAVNPSNGWRYLGFNLRKSPTKYRGFRQAMAYFDKENLTNNILQGAYIPLYVLVPEGNQAWYDKEIAAEISSRYVGLDTDQRLAAAYGALEADGFTWDTPAVFEDGVMISPGTELIDPEGTPVPQLEILSPNAEAQPDLHAASLLLEEWAEELGIAAEANPIDFLEVIPKIWPGVGVEPDVDMFIMGWGLGNPAWPTFHEEFFHTRNLAETTDGGNATGYSNPEFDALADAMFTETDYETAYGQVWEMEQMIARDLPYVPLFISPITEFYNADLTYPFTQTLSGIAYLSGMPGTVSK